jgi:CheY-like chemotaxis protein
VCPPNLANLTGLTLLVVDDNDDNLDMLGTFLRACGAHVLQARNAGSALAYVSTTTRIDAIITDLAMPTMDGVELARRVRQLPGRQSTPVIALTGFYEKYMNTHAARFDAFLRKPVNLDELCKTVLTLTQSR